LLQAGADVHRKDENGILALSRIKDASIDRQIRLLLFKARAAIALVDENVREGCEAYEREGGLDNRDGGIENVETGLEEGEEEDEGEEELGRMGDDKSDGDGI
jgi:hypothetical protein